MLDISPILLLSSGLVFLLVLARLNSCLYKPLFKHMDERDEKIKSDIQNASNNGADVEGMLAQATEIIANAKKEAFSIREKARVEAEKLAESKIETAKAKIETEYVQFTTALKATKKDLEDSLSVQMPLFKDGLQAKLRSI
jgi:F-type H+-transporting ATPase subunit b